MRSMKKILKATGIILGGFIALLLVLFLLVRFFFREQILTFLTQEQLKERVDLLQESRYQTDSNVVNFSIKADAQTAKVIRDYFQLDTLLTDKNTTWERAIAIAKFVNKNIPHDNQKDEVAQPNAIGLWKYHKTHPQGFNCRYHSILLHELLLAEGIGNRPVWCMPQDSADADCHVVNSVWLPEEARWVMLDSDQGGWFVDAMGQPMGLKEMRTSLVGNLPMKPMVMSENKNTDNSDLAALEYKAYFAKNLYWFMTWQTAGFNHDLWPRKERLYAHLVPAGFESFQLDKGEIEIRDPQEFWNFNDN